MPLANGQPTMMEALLAGERVKMSVGNRESNTANGITSPVDGSYHSNAKQYDNHLKQHGCHVKDYTLGPKKEVEGDFNVRAELRDATREVLSKQ